ncbi:regulator of (H+)-ATPase in vacuolar membrane [Mycoemilia scoparia]|uniref:Regulator of (H+)-ATPase in vacuolar membrane n=1 Tax=Mycoemilia scoparia TaxID=417184 RepID=A0A9W8DLH9_9FUNG|nr:regulator of (H+)-ATPase in vacuolar membrane [Mycoemilia scoparia]
MRISQFLVGKINESKPIAGFYDDDIYYMVYGSANCVHITSGERLVQTLTLDNGGNAQLVAALCVYDNAQLIGICQGNDVLLYIKKYQSNGLQWEKYQSFENDQAVARIQILSEKQVITASGNTLTLWNQNGDQWLKSYEKRLSADIYQISYSNTRPSFITTVSLLWRVDEDSFSLVQYLNHQSTVINISWSTLRYKNSESVIYISTKDNRVWVWVSSSPGNPEARFTIRSGLDVGSFIKDRIHIDPNNAQEYMPISAPQPIALNRYLYSLFFDTADRISQDSSRPSGASGVDHRITQRLLDDDNGVSSQNSSGSENGQKPLNSRKVHSFLNLTQLKSSSSTERPENGFRIRKFRETSCLKNSAIDNKVLPHIASAKLVPQDWFYTILHNGSILLCNFFMKQGELLVPKFRQPIITKDPCCKTFQNSANTDEFYSTVGFVTSDSTLSFIIIDMERRLLKYALKFPHRLGDASTSPPILIPELVNAYDGHMSPIEHISVNPFGSEIASYDQENNLLIWNPVGNSRVSVSNKIDLGGEEVKSISWAPNSREFVCLTNKSLYRYLYNDQDGQWNASSDEFADIGYHDCMFTYSLPNGDCKNECCVKNQYCVTLFHRDTKKSHSWSIDTNKLTVQDLGTSIIDNEEGFDCSSRVMPAMFPFSSIENLLVTYNTNTGSMNIWGLMPEGYTKWASTKQHSLPKLDVKMIRYNSVDKAAIVSEDSTGQQTVTIWRFSSASSSSLYFPAATIYPLDPKDKVKEIRWHLTDGAQSYLGILWGDRIDIYIQHRSLYESWKCIQKIHVSDYGSPDNVFESFSFTNLGAPIFSVGTRMYELFDSFGKDDQSLCELAFSNHGQVPYTHPAVLSKLILWGRLDSVKTILLGLYDKLKGCDPDSDTPISQIMIPLEEILGEMPEDTSATRSDSEAPSPASNAKPNQKYSDLFGDDNLGDFTVSMADLDIGGNDEDDGFNQEKARFIVEQLPHVKLAGISPIDQARLMCVAETIAMGVSTNQSIDEMGVRFMMMLNLHEYETRRSSRNTCLAYCALNWALHSNSQSALIQHCYQLCKGGHLTWPAARKMGMSLWIKEEPVLKQLVEKLAHDTYAQMDRNPSVCSLFFLALRKPRVVYTLWKTAHSHPEQAKMVKFLSNDFTLARWRTAASKNAFALLSKGRYWDAVTFFMLGEKLEDAALVCLSQLNDIHLAIMLCRCYEGDHGPVLDKLLKSKIIPHCVKTHDRWLLSLVFTLREKAEQALRALVDSLPKMAKDINIEAESPTTSMSEYDTELPILRQHLLATNPKISSTRKIDQSNVISQAATIFECLGQPIMALVVLNWWKKKKSEEKQNASASTSTRGPQELNTSASLFDSEPTIDSLMSGTLDFGNWNFGSTNTNTTSTSIFDSFNSKSTGTASTGDTNIFNKDSNVKSGPENSEFDDYPLQYSHRVTIARQVVEYLKNNRINYVEDTSYENDIKVITKLLDIDKCVTDF